MQTKHICVLIHIGSKGEVGAPFQGGASFVDHLCYFCIFCCAFMHVCLLMYCGHLLGNG